MTIHQALKALTSYPVPTRTFVKACEARGLAIDAEATAEIIREKAYQLAEADIMTFLSKAPNISEGGVSITLSDRQRSEYRTEANATYQLHGEPTKGTVYGFKGEDF